MSATSSQNDRKSGRPAVRTLQDYVPPSWGKSAVQMALRVGVIVVIALLAQALVSLAIDATELLPDAAQGPARIIVFSGALALYAVLIAIPFVPGVEIGVSLLIMQGAEIAPFVYCATVLGLLLAYLAGRSLPTAWLHSFFLDMRLRRACQLLDQIEPLSPERRLALLRAQLPDWLGRFVVRYRYIALAAAINVPGNSVIGGGGGISLVAGMSGIFHARAIVLTFVLAVLPIPLAVWVFGLDLLHSR